MTEYSLTDADGTVRWRGTISPAPGGASALEYIVTDYTVADVSDDGGIAALGPVTTLAPGDALLGAAIEITEAWNAADLLIQLVNDPGGAGDLSQSYDTALDGQVADPAAGLVDFRTVTSVAGSGDKAVTGFLPAGAPALPIWVSTGVLFGDQGTTGALTVRLIVVRSS